MEAQVSDIFLSIWNQQKNKSLSSRPPRIAEQGSGSQVAFRSEYPQRE